MTKQDTLGRFGHHPDPAIDFCEEVQILEGLIFDLRVGLIDNKEEVFDRVSRAMSFTVGGDKWAIDAKAVLRQLGSELEQFIKKSTTAVIVDSLNKAKFRGFDNWVDTIMGIVGGDDGEKILLSPDRAAREAAALRRNREALSLDAVMPLLEQIALCGDGRQDATRVGFFLEGGGFTDVGVGTTFADVVAVVEAWKARRAC